MNAICLPEYQDILHYGLMLFLLFFNLHNSFHAKSLQVSIFHTKQRYLVKKIDLVSVFLRLVVGRLLLVCPEAFVSSYLDLGHTIRQGYSLQDLF